MADAEKGQQIDPDDTNVFDEEEIDEKIPCTVSYFMICIMLPLMNGLLNSFAWSGYALYVRKNGWNLSLAGMFISIGCLGRLIVQQVIFRAGIWTCVIFAALGGTIAAIAIAYPDQEIVVFLQTSSIPAFDVGVAIEGLTFDTWSDSQEQVGQAQSTVLSIFTIAYALAATFGGVIYDVGSWTGISVFHATCSFVQLLVFVVQPAMLKSFREFIHRMRGGNEDDKDEDGEEVKELGDQVTSIVPGPKVTVIAAEVPASEPAVLPRGSEAGASGEAVPALPGALEEPEARSPPNAARERSHSAVTPTASRSSADAAAERQDRRSTLISPHLARSSIRSGSSRASSDRQNAGRRLTVASRATGASRRSRRNSRNTVGTNRTAETVLTNLSRFTSLTQMGENFQYNYGIQNGLRPHIASNAVEMAVQSDDEKDEKHEKDEKDEENAAAPRKTDGPQKRTTEKSKGLPRDVYPVAALIAMCSFSSNLAYGVEWATFAIFFAEQHNWTSATWAGICQTVGDISAAILMGLLKNMPRPNLDELHGIRRLWHGTFSHPYLLTIFVFGWFILHAGLCVPLLPVGIASQVLMGTLYVFTMKGVTDLNLFYSLGDSKAFLQLQVQCKNADAIGALIAGGCSFPLYEFNPIAPFVLCSGISLLTSIVVTIGFCCRVGFGQEIETAEARRARRLGVRRVSTWKSNRSTIRDE